MKMIIAAITAGVLSILPAYATPEHEQEQDQEHEIVGNTGAELGFLLQCTATELTLAHLRLQVAASLTALSAPNMEPQLAALASSYATLAKSDQERVNFYVNLLNVVLIPQITGDGKISLDVVSQKSKELVNATVAQMRATLGNINNSLEMQTEMERMLIEQSAGCESLANKVMSHHTY